MALELLGLSLRWFRIGLESSLELSYNPKGVKDLGGSLVQPSTQGRNPQDLPNKWLSSLCPRRQLFLRFVEVQKFPLILSWGPSLPGWALPCPQGLWRNPPPIFPGGALQGCEDSYEIFLRLKTSRKSSQDLAVVLVALPAPFPAPQRPSAVGTRSEPTSVPVNPSLHLLLMQSWVALAPLAAAANTHTAHTHLEACQEAKVSLSSTTPEYLQPCACKSDFSYPGAESYICHH